ncbi:hypothetical protein EJ08DRAFT_22209 [Tothia fuscella]|uniref:Uncharacterized protein n=1 Tax=Tothia fuscella TaxID=1048955 RepID=A0A9P4NZE4_9PEZI|nr:hypothetical protein EJ08DRAFT_22209 [Tothia fuscella]
MLLTTTLTLTFLTTFTSAWRVGLWPAPSSGRDQQYSGTIGAGRCHTLDSPIQLGKVTFDPRTTAWADMHSVIVYADKSCDPDFKIFSGDGIFLVGRAVYSSKTAKSFLVQ